MKKVMTTITAIIIIGFILLNIFCSKEIYLKYVFKNFKRSNFEVVDYLPNEDKDRIVKVYKYCKQNKIPEPLIFIKKEKNNYHVILQAIEYSTKKEDYNEIRRVYTAAFDIKIKNQFFLIPKIKKIVFIHESEDIEKWFNIILK